MSNKSKGALFVNDRRDTEKHPHWTGNLDLTKEQINELISLGKAGEPIKLRLAAWKSKAQNSGMEYISISAEPPMKKDQEMPF